MSLPSHSIDTAYRSEEDERRVEKEEEAQEPAVASSIRRVAVVIAACTCCGRLIPTDWMDRGTGYGRMLTWHGPCFGVAATTALPAPPRGDRSPIQRFSTNTRGPAHTVCGRHGSNESLDVLPSHEGSRRRRRPASTPPPLPAPRPTPSSVAGTIWNWDVRSRYRIDRIKLCLIGRVLTAGNRTTGVYTCCCARSAVCDLLSGSPLETAQTLITDAQRTASQPADIRLRRSKPHIEVCPLHLDGKRFGQAARGLSLPSGSSINSWCGSLWVRYRHRPSLYVS